MDQVEVEVDKLEVSGGLAQNGDVSLPSFVETKISMAVTIILAALVAGRRNSMIKYPIIQWNPFSCVHDF